MANLDPFALIRMQRGVEHLHGLGPRATCEFFVELGDRGGGLPATLDLLGQCERRLTPAMLHVTGGDRFPRHLREVPL
jgi:hypothetical protein